MTSNSKSGKWQSHRGLRNPRTIFCSPNPNLIVIIQDLRLIWKLLVPDVSITNSLLPNLFCEGSVSGSLALQSQCYPQPVPPPHPISPQPWREVDANKTRPAPGSTPGQNTVLRALLTSDTKTPFPDENTEAHRVLFCCLELLSTQNTIPFIQFFT